MSADKMKLPAYTRFTPGEMRAIEQARLRFHCRTMAEFLHAAALHFAGHNRQVARPTRAWQISRSEGDAADPAQEECPGLAGQGEGERKSHD